VMLLRRMGGGAGGGTGPSTSMTPRARRGIPCARCGIPCALCGIPCARCGIPCARCGLPSAYGEGMPQRSALIDLHTHSWSSDGTEPPGEVVRRAAQAGLGTVALTDHDVTAGWAEADEAGREHGVVVVPGIEISCSWRGIS